MKLTAKLSFGCVLYFIFASSFCAAADPAFYDWAKTPPMGWNSWDCFGTAVTEAQTKANTDYMAEHLASHGWQYIVVDIQWYEPAAKGLEYRSGAKLEMDAFGRLEPAVNRFPSAAGGKGFAPLADYVHAKGLKFGLHLLRGIPRQAVSQRTPIQATQFTAADVANVKDKCDWNPDMFGVDMTKPGAQAYYDSVFRQMADWHLDFVKVDDLGRPYHRAEVEAIRHAIDSCGRPIVFSVSPGNEPTGDGPHLSTHTNLWRITDDFWDDWAPLKKHFDTIRDWQKFSGPGHWADPDMLPLGAIQVKGGRTRFTPEEQQTLLTLWSISRAPLMFGGDMVKNDQATLDLITNDDVLAVDQHGTDARELFRHGSHIAWTSRVPDSKDIYLALFNTSDAFVDKAKAKFVSDVITRETPGQAVKIDVDVTGAKKLYLVVDDGGDNYNADHADWIEPTLTGPAGDQKLTDLKWVSATAGWGTARVNKSVGNAPMVVNGKPVAFGIGTHAKSIIEYDLPAGTQRFTCSAGLDQGGTSQKFGATVQFLVFTADPKPSEAGENIVVNLKDVGLSPGCGAVDLWSHRPVQTVDGFAPTVASHGARLFRLSPTK